MLLPYVSLSLNHDAVGISVAEVSWMCVEVVDDAAITGDVNAVAANVLDNADVAVNGDVAITVSDAIPAVFGAGAADGAVATLMSSDACRADARVTRPGAPGVVNTDAVTGAQDAADATDVAALFGVDIVKVVDATPVSWFKVPLVWHMLVVLVWLLQNSEMSPPWLKGAFAVAGSASLGSDTCQGAVVAATANSVEGD